VDEQQLLVMMIPTSLKDDMVDCLMSCEAISGFNMTATAGYSKEHSQYDLREQVQGHRQFAKFEVMHRPAQQIELLATVRVVCSAASIRYWIVPVLEQGHL
jgi:hypothetical protein